MKLRKRYSRLSYYTSDLIESVINLVSHSTKIENTIIVPSVGSGDFFNNICEQFPIISDSIGVQKKVLGEISTVEILKAKNNNVYFCQMYCENFKTNLSRKINYIDLVKAMINVKNLCINIHNKQERRVEIHCPKSGFVSSGGRWNTVADLLEDCWINNGINTFIYRNN